MDFLLPGLAFMTLILAIVFALWSQKKTEERLHESGKEHTPLARTTPDPNFLPDPKVTDPWNVAQGGRGMAPAPGPRSAHVRSGPHPDSRSDPRSDASHKAQPEVDPAANRETRPDPGHEVHREVAHDAHQEPRPDVGHEVKPEVEPAENRETRPEAARPAPSELH